MRDAYSEGSDLPAHLMKGICCGHNCLYTTSIIHSPLGGNSMSCWDWSKLTIPLVWAPFLSLQFSLVLIDISVLYSKLLLELLPWQALLLLATWSFLCARVAKKTTPGPIVIPTLPIVLVGHWLVAMATKWSLLLSGAWEPCRWAQGLFIQHKLFPFSVLHWVRLLSGPVPQLSPGEPHDSWCIDLSLWKSS